MAERKMVVLYGSQTGTAQDTAERVGRGGQRRRFQVKVHAMDSYDMSRLPYEPVVVFVCATTGQGDEPDNMKKAWRLMLRKSLPPDSLKNVGVAVLGLGDSSYQKYNYVGKRLHRRLVQLGATPLLPLALADDQHDLGIEAAVEPWMDQLWQVLMKLHPLPVGMSAISDLELLPPKYKATFISKADSILSDPLPLRSTSAVPAATVGEATPIISTQKYSRQHPYLARVLSNTRVTPPSHFQDVRLVTMDTSGSGISHGAGDVLMVRPRNIDSAVEEILALLNLDPRQPFNLELNDPEGSVPSLPCPCSICHLFTCHLDFQSVPRRSFFELLEKFARKSGDELEEEKLGEFLTAEGQQELFDYCYRPKRTILEVLADFPHATSKIPFPYLFDLIPVLQPRAFSIASSVVAHPGQIQILVAVVKYRSRLLKHRQGVCSTWLASLEPERDSVHVPVWVVPGTIRFPRQPKSRVIMVGPGTGCAPFRTYIEERASVNSKGNYLFFGCRSKRADFFFEEEWLPLAREGFLVLRAAFSRDQDEKEYVQHLIQHHGEEVWQWVGPGNAFFFIAGNSKNMPTSVVEALKEVCTKWGKMTEKAAEKFMKELETSKRLQMETWS